MIRGVRGAITVSQNDAEEITQAAQRLLNEMIIANNIIPDTVASVFISATDDVDAAFPARALRTFEGWKYVPVMCMKELAVPDSLKMCIRVMMHVNTNMAQEEIRHIYLEGAKILRPDL